jgi:hypothetical protein
MLESAAPEKQFEPLRRELIVLACAYVSACSAPVSLNGEATPRRDRLLSSFH